MVHIKLQVSVVFIAAAAAIAPIVALPVEGTNYIRGIPDPDDQLFAHQAEHPGNLQDVQMEEHTDLADHWIHEDSSHGNKSPTSAPSSWVYVQISSLTFFTGNHNTGFIQPCKITLLVAVDHQVLWVREYMFNYHFWLCDWFPQHRIPDDTPSHGSKSPSPGPSSWVLSWYVQWSSLTLSRISGVTQAARRVIAWRQIVICLFSLIFIYLRLINNLGTSPCPGPKDLTGCPDRLSFPTVKPFLSSWTDLQGWYPHSEENSTSTPKGGQVLYSIICTCHIIWLSTP